MNVRRLPLSGRRRRGRLASPGSPGCPGGLGRSGRMDRRRGQLLRR